MVATNETGDRLEIISFEPKLPVKFNGNGQNYKLNVKVSYTLASAEKCRIWVIPFTKGEPSDAGSHPSPEYTKGSGEFTGWFDLLEDGYVDRVKVMMGENPSLLELIVDVDAIWGNPFDLVIPPNASLSERVVSQNASIGTLQQGVYPIYDEGKVKTEGMLINATTISYGGKLIEYKDTNDPMFNNRVIIYAKPGAEFTIGVTAKYKVKSPIKLAANIKPDAHLMQEIAQKEGNFQLYNLTVHFDTKTRPSYKDVEGEGEINFTLTSWAPTQPGKYNKILEVGLYDPQTFQGFIMESTIFVLTVE